MSSESKPKLIVDHRQDKDFTRALTEHFEIDMRQLRCGDLVWSSPQGSVGLEDKCRADLTGSATNKRLDDELRRLVDRYEIPILFIRHTRPGRYGTWDDSAVENLKLGRQFHGAYTYDARGPHIEAAADLKRLYDYLAKPRTQGIEGVRRERRWTYQGPMGARAEVIYGILGLGPRIRDRRGVAISIAETTTIAEFMKWDAIDFESAGFTRDSARKMATVLRKLEGSTSWN